MQLPRFIVVVFAMVALTAQPAAAAPWYQHYANAEQALEAKDWSLAVQEINEALQRKGDSGARVRSYGMNFVAYFPYLRLGIAYYHLGQFDAALQAFDTEERLGAIARSEPASTELRRYRTLVEEARALATADAKRRIDEIVEQSLTAARELQRAGRLEDAMAALDQALAVAPGNEAAALAMSQLRLRFAERESDRDRERRAARLVDEGRALLGQGDYSEALSIFRQALDLAPNPATRALLDDAQDGLLASLENRRSDEEVQAVIRAGLDAVRELESAGRLAEALDRLQSVLVLAPSSAEAKAIETRLLQARKDAEEDAARQAMVDQLLARSSARLRDGSAEAALAAANQVLALDPGNTSALAYVAEAYGTISRRLLGTGPKGNLPPAVRFVDLRQEDEDGTLVQTVDRPLFLLNGVVIDDSPVAVAFYGDGDQVLEAVLDSQPLGEFHLTGFSVEAKLTPGRSTFRLVATDSEDLTSSSEYAVIYIRPVYRATWFYALLTVGLAFSGMAWWWQRSRRGARQRRRRFNPYVAGAPVLEDEMFFGRRKLVDRILQTIHNNSLLIYGERRIGKTSIQHQVKRRLNRLDDPDYEFHPVYVDLQGTPQTRFFETIAEDIFQELTPVLGDLRQTIAGSGDYSYRNFVHDVRAVIKRLGERTSKKVKLVLLIDEVDELNDYDPRVNQKLRSLFMKSFAENLATVVSGVEIKKDWDKEGSPWYNFFEEIQVEPLAPRDARDLIERPIRGVFKLSGGTVDRIIAQTSGKPYLIQKLCVSLVTRLHEQRRKTITVADVDAIAGTDGWA